MVAIPVVDGDDAVDPRNPVRTGAGRRPVHAQLAGVHPIASVRVRAARRRCRRGAGYARGQDPEPMVGVARRTAAARVVAGPRRSHCSQAPRARRVPAEAVGNLVRCAAGSLDHRQLWTRVLADRIDRARFHRNLRGLGRGAGAGDPGAASPSRGSSHPHQESRCWWRSRFRSGWPPCQATTSPSFGGWRWPRCGSGCWRGSWHWRCAAGARCKRGRIRSSGVHRCIDGFCTLARARLRGGIAARSGRRGWPVFLVTRRR